MGKMAKIYLIGAIIILFTGLVQSSPITGVVIDSLTGEPLPGVTVRIAGTNYGSSTDVTGRFTLNHDGDNSNQLDLSFHLIGYEDKSLKVSRNPGWENIRVTLVQSVWKLDMVVVTATRRNYILKDVPITTELITADEFAETGALTVDEALNSHIGIDITDDMSGKGISLRGLDPSRVLLLVDGKRIIGRVRGSIDMSQISLANVERIEIVKGTGSTLYGSDALGGVVNVITKKPSALGSVNLYNSFGSFNSYDFQAGLNSGILGNGTNITAKYEHTDGFDLDKRDEHTNGLENIDRFNVNNKTIFGLSPGFTLDVSLGFMAEQKEWIESEVVQIGVDRDTTYNFDDVENNYRYDAAINARRNLGSDADLTVGLQSSYYDHTWKKFSRANTWIDTSETIDDIYSASFQYNRMITGNHIFTFGGDITTEGLESDQLSSGSERIRYEDLYAQYEWKPVKRLSLLPGIRWEHHETYGNNYNPSLNIMWDACSFFNLRGAVNRGYRAPSIKELYFEFDHSAAGYKVIGGGEDLDPETSWNYSVTAEISYNRKAIHRLSVFRNDLKNLIEFSDGDFSDPTYWRGIYYYDNIIKARTSGLEWETEIKAHHNLDLSFSYTYLLARNLTEDIDLINRPQHTFKFNSGYRIEKIKTRINFWGYWHDHKLWVPRGNAPDRLSDEYAPSRWNLNASLSKNIFKSFDLFFRIENLTDEINATYGYWPERNYTISLTYNFDGSK